MLRGVDDAASDRVFAGSIPALYETHLVPLIFEPYAADLANRLAARSPARVLEIAAGTGVVTRALASVLPERAEIVATDLNQAMLDHAARVGTTRRIEWHRADAMQLPFADGAFDAVVCQFGVMFFPDKSRAFFEARRVLRSGGVLLFNVWDRIEDNEFADSVTTALAFVFPEDPPRFLARTPHGYHDLSTIGRDLAQRRVHRTAADRDDGGEESRHNCPDPGDRLLSGHAARRRDCGARRRAAGRSDRRCRRGDCPAVRTRGSRRQNPGAHRQRQTLTRSHAKVRSFNGTVKTPPRWAP